MPLPAPTEDRELLHTRTIECRGYQRADGMWDIDGWMTDIKTYNFPNHDRVEIKAGEPLHGMGLRVTVDDTLTIRDCVAVTDFSPFTMCGNITPNFKALIGLRITQGLTKNVQERLGGTQGCTHLVELIKPIATTAFQTLVGKRMGKLSAALKSGAIKRPPILDTCHAWAQDGEIVKREFPSHYTGA
ncbi:MAG: DUF2889 domain-containing protein [Alphaproteobacteria bacterium]|nr:DUF2889 domain-containing protein [Alphaproteobacteria bacterium]